MSTPPARILTDLKRRSVFLDSNVLLQFLKGKLDWLFSSAELDRFNYAINPIVLKELLLHGHGSEFINRLTSLRRLTELLPIDPRQAEALLQHARELRNRTVHSNDLLILSSAADCDYFVSDDWALLAVGHGMRPKFLSSVELEQLVEAKA